MVWNALNLRHSLKRLPRKQPRYHAAPEQTSCQANRLLNKDKNEESLFELVYTDSSTVDSVGLNRHRQALVDLSYCRSKFVLVARESHHCHVHIEDQLSRMQRRAAL